MSGQRLGRVFGFTIRAGADWLIVFVLMVAAFAVAVFPIALPGGSAIAYWLLAGVVTLLFYSCLLVHELSHALAARAKGISIDSITLFIFGGLVTMKSEPVRPRDDALITAVGPLTSTILALLFAGAAIAAAELGWSPATVAVLRYVAFLNGAVALFNLVPVFPLDGGRLLRALVWQLTGSLERATRVVSRASHMVALVLLALGVVRFIQGERGAGLAMVILGVVLRRTSAQHYRQQVLRNAMQTTRVRELVTGEWPQSAAGGSITAMADLKAVDQNDSVLQAMETLRASSGGVVAVRNGSEVLGVISTADVEAWLEPKRRARPS
jgi:Zn-dependent protease